MKADSLTRTEILTEVIRGKLPLTALSEGGIQVKFFGNICQVETETPLVYHPSSSELKAGLKYYESHPEELKKWAGFILSASPILDLDKIESNEADEQLIEMLWSASLSGKINDPLESI